VKSITRVHRSKSVADHFSFSAQQRTFGQLPGTEVEVIVMGKHVMRESAGLAGRNALGAPTGNA